MYGISIDIGTSGTRAHAIDSKTGKILSTAMTESHPLPGANVVDHLTFCIRVGKDLAHDILMQAVNRVIGELGIDLKKVDSVATRINQIDIYFYQNSFLCGELFDYSPHFCAK